MKTKSMARDAARIVHGSAADVRCRRHFDREQSGQFRAGYLAEVYGRAAVKGAGLKRGRRLVLEHAEGRSPAAAYDALCAQLHGRAYVQLHKVIADHGEAGTVSIAVGRSFGRDELGNFRAFVMRAEGDSETVAAALRLVDAMIGGGK